MSAPLTNAAPTQSRNKTIFKWALNIIIPAIFLFIPNSATGYTADIQMFFAVTAFGIILIATENIPMFASVILFPVLYSLGLGIGTDVAYASWTSDTPWLSIGASLLALGLTKSGFLKRISYRTVLLFGGSFRGLLYGMMVAGIIISAVTTNMVAKGVLLAAFAVGLCNALDFKMGSRESSAVGLAAIAACLGPSYLYVTGSGGTIVTMGIAAAAGVNTPNWGEYVIQMAIPQLIYIFLTVLIIDLFFKPKNIKLNADNLRNELGNMGKLEGGERKTAIICIILIVLLATTSFHGLPYYQLFTFAGVALMVPTIGVVQQSDIKEMNFTGIIFVISCLTIGTVSTYVGAGTFIANIVYPYIQGSITTLLGGVWGLGFIANFGLTPSAAYAMFTEPVIQIANAAGINPLPVIYTFVHSLEQVLLPYEYAPVLIIYGYGMISFGRFVKYNALRAVLSFACIFLIFVPYWNLIGLL